MKLPRNKWIHCILFVICLAYAESCGARKKQPKVEEPTPNDSKTLSTNDASVDETSPETKLKRDVDITGLSRGIKKSPKDKKDTTPPKVDASSKPDKETEYGIVFPPSQEPTPPNVCKILKDLENSEDKKGIQVALVIDPQLNEDKDKKDLVIATEVTLPKSTQKRKQTVCDAIREARISLSEGEEPRPVTLELKDHPPMLDNPCKEVMLKNLEDRPPEDNKYWVYMLRDHDQSLREATGIAADEVKDGTVIAFTFTSSQAMSDKPGVYIVDFPPRVNLDNCK